LLDDNLRPIPQTNVDYTSLPINPTPEEYFLLSRINGNVTVGEICQISGLSIEATHKALARLQEAGLIKIPEPEKKTAAESGMYDSVEGVDFGQEEVATPAAGVEDADPASSAPSDSRPAEHRPPPKVEVMGTSMLNPAPELDVDDGLGPAFFEGWPVAFSSYSFDPDAISESVSISDELKRYILFIHAHIGKVDYYKVLGVPRDAGRKDVRAAYFTLSKIFHPDSFYGKETGSYSEKIDDIFQSLNKAHQTLSNKNKRSDYDATLAAADSAPSAASSPQSTSPAAADAAQSAGGGSTPQSDKKKEMAFGVLVKRGEKHEAAGEYVEAAAEYKKAFAIKHDPLVALRGANLLMRSGEEHIGDAILLAKAAAKEDPGNAKPLILIGDAYEEKGDYEAARDYYERARAVEPDNKVVGRRLKYLQTAAQ